MLLAALTNWLNYILKIQQQHAPPETPRSPDEREEKQTIMNHDNNF